MCRWRNIDGLPIIIGQIGCDRGSPCSDCVSPRLKCIHSVAASDQQLQSRECWCQHNSKSHLRKIIPLKYLYDLVYLVNRKSMTLPRISTASKSSYRGLTCIPRQNSPKKALCGISVEPIQRSLWLSMHLVADLYGIIRLISSILSKLLWKREIRKMYDTGRNPLPHWVAIRSR